MNEVRLFQLLDLYTRNELLPEEQTELRLAIADPINAEILKRWIDERWESEELPEILSKIKSAQLYKKLNEKIAPKKRKVTRAFIIKTAAAASIVFALSTSIYLLLDNNQDKLDNRVSSVENQTFDKKAPKVTQASIILENGNVICVDSLSKGNIKAAEGVEIVKLNDGHLQYIGFTETVTNNTLLNPRGSDVVSINLSDGTKIWLNASSQITYPTSFDSNERKVELIGEAYFEVANNKGKPFIVNVNNKIDVKVLGTEFNIKAYDDEASVNATLISGSVEILDKKSQDRSLSVILKPGQQGYMDEKGELLVKNVDINESIAWKKGIFYFSDASLESIMKSLARWYDVEIEYINSDLKKLKFGAVISRRENISAITNLLKITGTVDFEITEDKIIVTNVN